MTAHARRARRLATAVRAHLRAAGVTVLRSNQDGDVREVAVYVFANDVIDGRVTVLVIGPGERKVRSRVREVLSGHGHRVGYDPLGMTLTVQA